MDYSLENCANTFAIGLASWNTVEFIGKMCYPLVFFLLCMFIQCEETKGGKILAVLPTASFSHQILYMGFLRKLNERGHELVVVTPEPQNDKSLKNYTEISIRETYANVQSVDFIKFRQETNWMDGRDYVWGITLDILDILFQTKGVKELYEHGNMQKFDLLLVEYVFFPGILALAPKLNTPYIGNLFN